MHFRGLDLNLLVALDALLVERNVTRASERVGISQPGMSAALTRLRRHFDDPLLERQGQRLELTPRAREIAHGVSDVLGAVDTLMKARPRFDAAVSDRVFSLAMSTYCSEMMGARMATVLAQSAPNVVVQVEDLTVNSLTRLDTGQYDACITVAQRAILDPAYTGGALREQHLFTDRFCVVAARSNDAFARISTLEEFCKLPYVEVIFSGHVTNIIDYSFRGQAIRPRTRMTVPSFSSALHLVAGSDFVTIAPERMFRRYEDLLRLRSLPLALPLPDLEETLMWHLRADHDSGSTWLRDLLAGVAADI